ncbi:beta-1,6-N-acetylglucosaminyltransferase [Paucihalobacter ruber]|uniref:Peptide O-xylosyltransferase n=1 Tax=Paucihalobacter ruber TaxID=2567861 RepID=A0A506PKZ8_9FLAO|nr:beta-1,6-N-acetylglucosaminyltransferase [Paucihalobacter ruber]TPV33862.1 beta-1,6-N-acetylglucosaminyltransferase [Paucihalobacter ruber]
MKQAILITAYKNFEHLYEIANFFDQRFEIYIHVDKKSELPNKVINELSTLPQVKLVSQKYKVNWGGINHLKCILYLSVEALKNKNINRFHVITGHDYPVKTKDYFISFFESHQENNYMVYRELPYQNWPNGGLDRLEYYNFYDWINAKKHRPLIFKLVNWQKKLGIKRKLSKKLPKLYGGESYWSLNRKALAYIMEYTKEEPYFLRRMKHSFCSEEIYIQTVLMNSKYANTVVNDSLRYIEWSNRNGNFPANLDRTDLEPILSSNKFFARKFEYPVSQDLLTALKNYLNSNLPFSKL